MKFDISDDVKNKNGVYLIECVNGMLYVGSTYRLSKAFPPHAGFFGRYYQYCNSGIYNKKIQNCINKYGVSSLTMKLLEVVEGDQSSVRERELFYINKLQTFGTTHGLNLKLSSNGGNGGANKGKIYPPRSKEAIEKTRTKLKGRSHRPWTTEERKKSSEIRKGLKSTSSMRYIITIFDSSNNTRTTLNSVQDIIHTSLPISRIALRKALWARTKKIADSIEIESAIKGSERII